MSEERDPIKFPFLAPELNKGHKQSTKSDIFALRYMLRHISHTIKISHLVNFTEAAFQIAFSAP